MSQALSQQTTPKQAQTDEWAVFADQRGQVDQHEELVLIDRVEVPQFTQPTSNGVKMDRGKRLSLAVYRALEIGHNSEPTPGTEFMVMTDLSGPMAFAEYEDNPAFDAVWNPASVK